MIDKQDVWAFPDLHSQDNSSSVFEREFIEKEITLQAKINELANLLNEKEIHLQDASHRAECYQAELQAQALLIKKLSIEVQAILPELGQHILTFVDDIVKKITKKIMMKEVAVDPQLISNLVANFIKQLDSTEMINVSVSANNFARLSANETSPSIRWRINPDLGDADVIVATDSSAMRMILDDVLNQLMSGSYDPIN